ncbi:hypothetical protein [Mesorhizobium sp. INR15]|nr:hypothetical protein [Mesorhizobium sp. INR15]
MVWIVVFITAYVGPSIS